MPSTSPAQHRFMEAVARNPAVAKQAGIPQAVGRDFVQADKGKPMADKPKKMAKALLSYRGA